MHRLRLSGFAGLALCACLCALLASTATYAQEKGEPGRFDFYLLNLSWSSDFCSIKGTSPRCVARPGFVVHGLWPENNDGTYPVFCAERAGPKKPEANLDITPDLPLLRHEWDKHGTCTTLQPEAFFRLERKAFRHLAVPKLLLNLRHEIELRPDEILDLFQKANPSYPAGSIVLSCGNNQLTAIEACLSKDGLKALVCSHVPGCDAQAVRVVPQTQ